MTISVSVPKNLSTIKTKIIKNLTKRQLICFSGAGLIGIPFYIATRKVIGTQTAMFLMVILMLPFFFFAMYEKDGFPAEKILYLMIRQKLLLPEKRIYRSEQMSKEERQELQKEVKVLEAKARRSVPNSKKIISKRAEPKGTDESREQKT